MKFKYLMKIIIQKKNYLYNIKDEYFYIVLHKSIFIKKY